MPDLGAYAGTVLAAYGVTLALLGLLVLVSALRGARLRRALARLERPPRPDGRPSREKRPTPLRSRDADA